MSRVQRLEHLSRIQALLDDAITLIQLHKDYEAALEAIQEAYETAYNMENDITYH